MSDFEVFMPNCDICGKEKGGYNCLILKTIQPYESRRKEGKVCTACIIEYYDSFPLAISNDPYRKI